MRVVGGVLVYGCWYGEPSSLHRSVGFLLRGLQNSQLALKALDLHPQCSFRL